MRQRAVFSFSPRLLAAALLTCMATTFLTADVARAGDLSGCWEGCWVNWHDRFSGHINVRIWKCDATHYEGEFSGIALLVIPYRYRATLTVTGKEDGKTYFTSYRHLPIWGGYKLCGYVSGCKFVARYDKCDGSGGGCWNMTRTSSCGGCCCR